MRPFAAAAALRILVHVALIGFIGADSALVLAERLHDFLVDEQLQGGRLLLRRRVYNLVALEPLPVVWLPFSLQVALVLQHVLNVPRIYEVTLVDFLEPEVEIQEPLVYFDWFLDKVQLRERIDHLVALGSHLPQCAIHDVLKLPCCLFVEPLSERGEFGFEDALDLFKRNHK